MANIYPLWKLVSEEIDSYEDKFWSHSVCCKVSKDIDWVTLYQTCMEPLARVVLPRLQDMYDPRLKMFLSGQEPAMFEIHDQVYKTTYVFPFQSCICGEIIAGNNHYGEISIEPIKFDYANNVVFFYDEGDCLVKGNQLFLNGELLFNSKDFVALCKEIGQELMYLDSSPDILIKYIAENYQEAKTYSCNGYTCYDITRYR